jgi:hypothetical protein
MRSNPVLSMLLLIFAMGSARVGHADDAPYEPDALARLVEDVVVEVESIRGLTFLRPVPVRVVDAATVRAYVLARVEEHLPADLLRNEADVYADLGLIERSIDLLETMLELLQQEVAAFYDPEEKIVFLLEHQPWSVAGTFLAHELTHALDDQHFDLDHSLREDDHENDRALAHAGAREGSGTAVMTVYMTRAIRAGLLSADALSAAMAEQERGRDAMHRAPPVLQRALLAPYLLGQHFVVRGRPARLWSAFLPADLDTVLTRLPESTEQLLHPEKYWSDDDRDPPLRIDLPPLDEFVSEDWTVAGEGTIGELDLACLTGPCPVPSIVGAATGWTNPGAMGWAGDRWRLLRRGERTITVWLLAWDGDEDAAEFERDARLPEGTIVRSEGRRTVVIAGAGADDAIEMAAAVLQNSTLRVREP